MSRIRRILLAKPGLDGHDRGIHVLAHGMRDAGYEVILTGRFQTPASIARAAVQEDVDLVGLSVLAGGHIGIAEEVVEELRGSGAECGVLVGGTIPDGDIDALKRLGCAGVFPVGSTLEEILEWIGSAEKLMVSV